MASGDCHDGAGWRPVSPSHEKIVPSPLSALQLQNRFSALEAGGGGHII